MRILQYDEYRPRLPRSGKPLGDLVFAGPTHINVNEYRDPDRVVGARNAR